MHPEIDEKDGLPVEVFPSTGDWDRWLEEHGETARGVWLAFAKKNSGVVTVSYAEALEVALCHGWIDRKIATFDARYYLQRFTHRRPRSKWSQVNREKALALIAAGRMRPAGLREVEAARADGRWEAAYEGQRVVTMPDDLRQALEADERARAFFETLNRANRYSIIARLLDAKRPETRERRLARFMAMLAEGKKLHP